MSGHDDQIGQEWTSESYLDRSMKHVFEHLVGEEPGFIWVLMGYVSASAPREFREGLLATEHSLGRHAEGKCPERCPRF